MSLLDLKPKLIRKYKNLNKYMIIYPNYLVNETGAKIIELCNGNYTVKEIIETIKNSYENEHYSKIEEDVINFLHTLYSLNIVIFNNE
ncbi:MAG: PqqD family protein [Sulfolobaceae archaeon]